MKDIQEIDKKDFDELLKQKEFFNVDTHDKLMNYFDGLRNASKTKLIYDEVDIYFDSTLVAYRPYEGLKIHQIDNSLFIMCENSWEEGYGENTITISKYYTFTL